MTPDQLRALGTAFTSYLQLFADCFVHNRTVRHLHGYCRGLLSDLPRKSIEPMALACGTAVRTLQEFLRDHVWDHLRLRDQWQQRLARLPLLGVADDLGTIGVIDETSTAKKGTKTPGVRRQWCGSLGKIENCVVTVHLAIVRGRFKTLVDADLFLPSVWSEDRKRCREAAIPDAVVYRPKWRIALEQLTRAVSNGLSLDWLTFDEYYGSKPGFLEALDGHAGQSYIGEIPKNFRCLAVRPRGKKPPTGWKGKRVDNLARFSPTWNQQDWHGVSLVKYFLSNASADTSVEKLLRVGFSRWHVEHTFRVAKTEIGFSHFEGRSYVALMRHMILCVVVMGFVAEHSDRLRGEKSGDHFGTGVPGLEPTLPDLAEEAPGDDG